MPGARYQRPRDVPVFNPDHELFDRLTLWWPGCDMTTWERASTGNNNKIAMRRRTMSLSGTGQTWGMTNDGICAQFAAAGVRYQDAGFAWDRSDNPPLQPCTLIAWIAPTPDDLTNSSSVFSMGQWSNADRLQFQFSTTAQVAARHIESGGGDAGSCYSNTDVVLTDEPSLVVAEWYYNNPGAAWRVLVFNRKFSTPDITTWSDTTTWWEPTTFRCAFGGRWNGSTYGLYYYGKLWDVRIYSGKPRLTEKQIADLWQPETRWSHYWVPGRKWWWLTSAGASGTPVTITPGAGGWQYAGAAPTLVFARVVAPTTGTAVIVPAAPAAVTLGIAAPSNGAVVVLGLAPTASTTAAQTVSPGTGAGVWSGLAPTLVKVTHDKPSPSWGLIQVLGAAPTLSRTNASAPAAGAVQALGLAPTVILSAYFVQPGVGTVRVLGGAPDSITPVLVSGTIRVEVADTDRTADTRLDGLTITRRVGAASTCEMTLHSTGASWRPGLMDALEVWQPWRRATDAAITASDATLTSTTAAFTSGDIGKHVRVAGAGSGGYPLYAQIASYTSATSVELDTTAKTTVTGKALLVGTCRFRGMVSAAPETRIGSRPNSREWRVSGVDLVAATKKIWATVDYGTSLFDPPDPVRTVQEHIAEILSQTDCAAHALSCTQTSADDFTWADTSGWLYALIDAAVATWASDDGVDRWWGITPLGRVVVYSMDGYAYTGDALTDANANILLRPTFGRSDRGYFNRITITGNTKEFSYSAFRDHSETYDNTSEQAALGDRVFEAAPITVGTYPDPNVPAWIVLDADLVTYAQQLQAKVSRSAWDLQVETFEDGIAEGMTVPVTVAEFGISAVDHFVQEVASTWMAHGAWRHRVTANGQQTTYTTAWDRWAAWRP